MEVITPEVAQQEVNQWLDFKKVSEKRRENYKENIETLVGSIVTGQLTLDQDSKEFTQNLLLPITAEGTDKVTVDKLVFKPRIAVKQIRTQMQGVKSTDLQGMILGYIAALTGKPKEVLANLDTEDYTVAQAIAIFFLG